MENQVPCVLIVDDDPNLMGSISAVSYTHLRAHETVLDLVCRLLLEKKKITLMYESVGSKQN